MTDTDYVRAVTIIRSFTYPYMAAEGQANTLINAFVLFFRGDNPRFDEDMFRADCRIKKQA